MTWSHKPASHFMLRAPAFPFQTVIEACASVDALREAAADPYVRDALYVASPEFAAQVDHWRASATADAALERALVRYVSRLAGRCTPFGLFAGVALGAVGDETRLELGPRERHRRRPRLDVQALDALCARLVRDPEIRGALRFSTSSSLYRAAGRWRYVEHAAAHGYRLLAVEPSRPLDAVLDRARGGATIAALVETVCRDPEIDAEDAAAFLAELVETQLLVPDLAPQVTGAEPGRALADALAAIPETRAAAAALATALRGLAELEGTPAGSVRASCEAIATTLRALVEPSPAHELVHVDLHLEARATLGPRVFEELRRGVEVLRHLAPKPSDASGEWGRFRAAFHTRYGTREVPLVEALDEELGIGFGDRDETMQGGLVDDLSFPDGPGAPPEALERDRHLIWLHGKTLAARALELELTDADIAVLSRGRPAELPDTFAVIAEVAADSTQELDRGNFRVKLYQLPGASGARLFTRFAHGSPGFTALARELADAEARLEPHCVLAEVVHLPQPRGGNLVTRPVLRRYEIPYLGAGGAERIEVSELLVSVGERVVLRSPRLGKEVRPMLSTAHHFESHDLAMYRFLCAVAQQQLPVGAFHWGVLADAPFLPRVRHGKAILFPAQWVLDPADQHALEHASRGLRGTEVAAARRRVFAEVARIRAARGWPRWIVCAESDHELVVDLDSELSVESMVHFLKGRRTPRVIEMIPAPHELCATGPDGAYLHQIVVPFVRDGAATDAPPPRSAPAMPARRCHPGSRWVFAKLYGGPLGLEATLRDVVGPLARAASAAERWFFVRYSDPEYHLRVRFEGEPARLAAELLPRLWEQLRPAADDGIVWRMQLETYEREVERYGGEHGMLLSESVFAADSEAALAILELTAPGDDQRWWSTLLGIDALMGDFRLGLRERLALVGKARDELGATLGMNVALKRQLGVKFREHREALGALLDGGHADAPGRAVFAERSRRLLPVADELYAADRAGRLTLPIPLLVSSYIHMHVNRMLSTNHQRQELVLYDLLRRYYDGRVSRAE